MNFDGITTVMKYVKNFFVSADGIAKCFPSQNSLDTSYSLEVKECLVRNNQKAIVGDSSFVPPYSIVPVLSEGGVVMSVYVLDGNSFITGTVPMKSISTTSIDKTKRTVKIGFLPVSISAMDYDRVVRTNMRMDTVRVRVMDSSQSQIVRKSLLNVTSVQSYDKTNPIIANSVNQLTDVILLTQKDNFIEITLGDKIASVVGIPNGLEYNSGYIKGTITKSGEHTIVVTYNDGSKTVYKITVPYYQRLL